MMNLWPSTLWTSISTNMLSECSSALPRNAYSVVNFELRRGTQQMDNRSTSTDCNVGSEESEMHQSARYILSPI